MINVVTAGQMREMDRRTIKDLGIPGIILMENAGLGVVPVAEEMAGAAGNGKILIICGKGNNGGDGMVVARHLLNRGLETEVILLGKKTDVSGDALVNLRILSSMGGKVREVEAIRQFPRVSEISLIIDAVFGTGITGDIKGIAAQAIRWVNRSGRPVLSIDLPSGLNSDDGSFEGTCVRADQTVTMAELKRGLVLPPGREMAGAVSIADISMPLSIPGDVGVSTFMLEDIDIAARLPERPRAAHKGDFGKVFILAGSPGLTGAAALSSLASLRIGCGLTVLGIPESLNAVLESKCTEVMTRPLPETEGGNLSLEAEKDILKNVEWADVVAIGPGLSTAKETSLLVQRIVKKVRKPVVIDADGLNAFTKQPDLLKGSDGLRILTPHYGELSRIIGRSIDAICSQPVETVREFSAYWNCVLVLKGSPTLIGDPSGNVYINPTGNSGLATAGSGDVLTGMITGLLAQKMRPSDAALCGVYSHGAAGDAAAELMGERSLMAADLLDMLPEVLQDFEDLR